MKHWAPGAFAGLAVGALLVVSYRALNAPAALDASTTCATLLRAACERQRTCPGCQTARPVACSAIVEAELAACVEQAASGETFGAAAVGACQRAFLGQPCPMACEQFEDPAACQPFAWLNRR